jgi:hypothetical protein
MKKATVTRNQDQQCRVFFYESGSVEGFAQVLREADQWQGVESIVALSCDSNGFTPHCLDDILQSTTKPLVGGIFPRITLSGAIYSKGTVLLGLPFKVKQQTFHKQDLHGALSSEAPSGEKDNLAIVFVDGISPNNQQYTHLLYDQLGVGVKMIGGGAGSLDFQPRPCLITNKGLIADACLVAKASAPCGVATTHGWTPASRHLEVTESDGKRIISLDWQPARKVYGEIIGNLSSISIDEGVFFDNAKGHPLGIISMGSEVIVRDLIGVDGDCLLGVSEIQPRTIVSVLKGDKGTLLDSARSCPNIALTDLGDTQPLVGLLMDCISRCLFLGESTVKELEQLTLEGIPLVGAFTIGEIASDGKSMVELHNKTTALALLGANS